jgi:hypothetical protein
MCIAKGQREKRVQGRILGTKKDEIIGEWNILHNEEFHNVTYIHIREDGLVYIIRKIKVKKM